MKTNSLTPLKLDKQTIALLDSQQLNDVLGGQNHHVAASGGGGSTGCGSGSSQCRVVAAR